MANGDLMLTIESTVAKAASSNEMDLGSSTIKFKDCYLAGNLYSTGRFIGVNSKTAAYPLGANDGLVVFSAATGITATLPAATGTGRKYILKSINSGTIVIDPNGTDTIDGSANEYLYQFESAQLVDYASGNWSIV